ncbi:hypothetical protein [uncultured Anaerofustis sp.]|uniref:hypothetical protein n=1 Tax=uncultured Anaerofustis sp. TaxID=904996 RepID=UPI0025FA75BA|nr:hypothetical protein [uncultured Anaerofustis sp.]
MKTKYKFIDIAINKDLKNDLDKYCEEDNKDYDDVIAMRLNEYMNKYDFNKKQ